MMTMKKKSINLPGGVSHVVKYGMHKIGNQEPYFSITLDTYEYGKLVACGQQHATIQARFPELVFLLKWHLVSFPSGPMHYEANGLYWLQVVNGVEKYPAYSRTEAPEKALDHFKQTVVFGVVDGDYVPSLEGFKEWAALRLPALMFRFRLEMERAGIQLSEDESKAA